MSNVVDNNLALSFGVRPRTSATPCSENEHMGIMFGVVKYVSTSEQQRKSCRPLLCAVAEEAGQECVAGEVAGTTDTVHQFGACYMGGVYMTAISISRAVFMPITPIRRTTSPLLEISCGRRTNFVVLLNVCIEVFQSIRGWGQGSTGNHVDLVFINQVEHAILNNFGVYGKVLEIRFNEAVITARLPRCSRRTAEAGGFPEVFRVSLHSSGSSPGCCP